MHTHNLDFQLPGGIGRVKADIHHEPHDDDHIMLVIHVHRLPHIAKMALEIKGHRNVYKEPIRRPVKRDFIRKWCNQGLEWANEPAPGV